MGFMTSFYVLNDGLDVIESHPKEFVEGLVRYASSGHVHRTGANPEVGRWAESFSVGNFANPAGVVDVAHADTVQVVMFGGNTATLLGHGWGLDYYTKDGVKRVLQTVLEPHGLTVVKKRQG